MTEPGPKHRVVILGGYGVFGGKLAEALLRKPKFDVIVAGRTLSTAQAFCRKHGGTPIALDRSSKGFAAELAALKPFVTVDAAGPFQDYAADTYCVVHAALDAGSHYLDLSDDGTFTKGIAALNADAVRQGKTVLSGASSVPALSSAAVESMCEDFSRLDLIESAILPGNRAPRGLSLMRAILAQTGRPLSVFRDGGWTSVLGWFGMSRRKIGGPKTGLPSRWTSLIGAPDLLLFADHYRARTVLFRAGLELSILHLGLWCLGWLVRIRLLRSLEPFAKALQSIATWFERMGTDRGGMEVRLAGLDLSRRPLDRRWILIAEAGDGPHIPSVAAAVLCEKIANGSVDPGARPCLGEFDLSDVAAATSHLAVSTFSSEVRQPTLFQQLLGEDFSELPEMVASLHTVFDKRRWQGQAKVTHGKSAIGKLVCRLVGFPPAAEKVPVSVIIERRGDKERWRRTFGDKTFRSVLSKRDQEGKGHLAERFGPMTFHIDLRNDGGRLHYPVVSGRFLGMPLPRWLLPVSEASEFEDIGRFNFDVKISLLGLGMLVRYRGWLEARNDALEQVSCAAS